MPGDEVSKPGPSCLRSVSRRVRSFSAKSLKRAGLTGNWPARAAWVLSRNPFSIWDRRGASSSAFGSQAINPAWFIGVKDGLDPRRFKDERRQQVLNPLLLSECGGLLLEEARLRCLQGTLFGCWPRYIDGALGFRNRPLVLVGLLLNDIAVTIPDYFRIDFQFIPRRNHW